MTYGLQKRFVDIAQRDLVFEESDRLTNRILDVVQIFVFRDFKELCDPLIAFLERVPRGTVAQKVTSLKNYFN